MRTLAAVPLTAAAILAVAIAWASMRADIGESFARMIADPWGVVTLIDLYAGFAVMLVVVWLVEPDRRIAVAATMLTPVLGSLVPAVWLAARIGHLAARRRDGA